LISGKFLRGQALPEKFRNQWFGAEFIDQNGGGAGVRLHKTSAAKTIQIKSSALEWRK
jgi:hypothetical protein